MSFFALLLLLFHILLFGIQKSDDENTTARLFQLLLAGQLPIIGYFGIKWFPKNRKNVAQIILLQIIAAIIPILTVFFLEKSFF